MIKIYILIVVLGLVGGVCYGGYYYYKDTQERIQTLTENNAKLETAKQLQDDTINAMIEDREKFEELNNELQKKLQAANNYRDTLIGKLRKHNLLVLSLKKPKLVEKKINNGTKKLFESFEAISGAIAPPASGDGCSSFRKVLPLEVKTVEVERKIPAQARPKSVSLNNIYFYVVTDRNFGDFKKTFEKENGDLVFYAVSVRDYETLALNMAELKRYIQQQKELIIYYEKAIKPKEKKETPKK